MIFNILDNTTELWMTKYMIGEIFSSGRATLYKNPSDQTVFHFEKNSWQTYKTLVAYFKSSSIIILNNLNLPSYCLHSDHAIILHNLNY